MTVSQQLRLAVVVTWIVIAQSASGQHTFEPAKRLELDSPQYPTSERRNAGEGWVMLSYVVTREGQVIDPVIVASTGNQEFNERALQQVSSAVYSPATMNGEPVESVVRNRFIFQLDPPATRVSRSFYSDFRSWQRKAAKGDLQDAEKELQHMEERGFRNLFEFAHFSYMAGMTAVVAGRHDDALRHLHNLFDTQQWADYLAGNLYLAALQQLFYEEVRMGRLRDALHSYQQLKDAPAAEDGDNEDIDREALESTHAKVLAAIEGQGLIRVSAQTDSQGIFWHHLARRGFALQFPAAALQTVDVRCDGHRQVLPLAPDSEYRIPSGWGDCNLRIMGNANASFAVFELPDS